MSYASDVISWYKSVQFRNPPTDELNSLVVQLETGTPALTVKQEIISQPYTLNVVNPIVREYQTAFNRVPDQKGENFWVNSFGDNTTDLTQISTVFANSAEFYGLYQATATTSANLRIIDGLYTNALGRAPDAAGEQYWLNSGLDAAQLLQAFSQSAEMVAKNANYIREYQLREMDNAPQINGPLFPNPHVEKLLTGIGFKDDINLGWVPPDNALAVGSSYVVSSENSAIMWIDLQGTMKVEQTLQNFFSPLSSSKIPTDHIYDPRALYDISNGHYTVVADQGNTPDNNYLLIAISNTSDPNKGWIEYGIPTNYKIGNTPTWADYPSISTSGKYLYISTNQFDQNNSYIAPILTVFDTSTGKQLSAQQLSYNLTYNTTADPNGGAFLVAYNSESGQLQINHVLATNIEPSTFITLPNISKETPLPIQQPNTPYALDSGDNRVVSTALVNDHLYAIFEVNSTEVSSSGAAVHWVDINVRNRSNPFLVSQGDILGNRISSDPSAATFNGSIAADKSGNIIINFTAGGKTFVANDYYTIHKVTDPIGYFNLPVPYQFGTSSYVANPDANGTSRWGDYSSAVSDPNNLDGFWISNEYATNTTKWSTSIAHITGFA